MPDFTLDDTTLGVLAGGAFTTNSMRLGGSFRDIQFTFSNNTIDADVQPHFFEFHYVDIGVVEATGIL